MTRPEVAMHCSLSESVRSAADGAKYPHRVLVGSGCPADNRVSLTAACAP